MPEISHFNGAKARAPRKLTGQTVLICLVAFFAVVAGVNAIMIRFAVSTFGGLETESSYKAGLAFAREVAAAHAQDARHWQVRASILPEPDGRRIDIDARDADGRPVTNAVANVMLTHPTDRRSDRSIAMVETAPGRYTGTAAVVVGQWDLVIELNRDDERMFRSKSRVILR